MHQLPFLYLASSSPRRRDLLRMIGLHFEVLLSRNVPRANNNLPPDVIEQRLSSESAGGYVERIACEKATAGWQSLSLRRLPIHPVLAADTEVILNDEVFGKPENAQHAQQMLQKLAGTTHEVRTTVALYRNTGLQHVTSISQVTMAQLSTTDIERYISSGECFGKAGGYALQGRGALLIEKVVGSPSGIIGLPLYETGQLLHAAGLML
jgi:septum formation protein